MSNLKWIAALLLLGISFAIGLMTGRAQIQGKWNLHKLEMADNAVKASEEYRAKERSWNQQLQEANKNANEREIKIRNNLNATTADNKRLRDTINSISSRLSGDTADARLETANTGLELLGECADAYIGMAEAADRHANDARTLSEAWPK